MICRKLKTKGCISVVLCIFLLNCSDYIKKEKIDLSGTWLVRASDELHYKELDYDDKDWEKIDLPGSSILPKSVNIDSLHNTGYVWLRKHVFIDTLPKEDMSLFIREIMNADETYWNGNYIGKTAEFPPMFRSGWSNARSYRIPISLIKQGVNVIAMRVYYDTETWCSGPVEILPYKEGRAKKQLYDFLFIHLIESFTVLLFAISLFFVFFFIKRRKEIETLFFAGASLAVCTALGLHFIENKYAMVPISSNNILLLTQLGLIAFPPFLSLFLHQYIQSKVNIKRLIFTLLVPTIAMILLFMCKSRYEILQCRNIFLIIILFFIIDAIVFSMKNLHKNRKKALTFLYAMAPLFILGIHDVLAFGLRLFPNSVPLYIYGLPMLLIVIAIQLINRFVNSLSETEELNVTLTTMTQSFARFVPGEFLQYLQKQSILEVMLGDAILTSMTVLFMDIRNFTTLSEKLKPQEILSFLNSFLKNFQPVISQYNGVIDKFIGDAIMALYATNSSLAVKSAIYMREQLKEYNKYRMNKNYEPIDFGIGINSGDVVLGTVGSIDRMDTTVIGDTVNMAERMEELTKIYKVPIIISENSYMSLEKSHNFHIRKIDIIKFLGKKTPIGVYEVFDCDDDRTKEEKLRLKEIFDEAISLYLLGRFNEALKIFNEYTKEFPLDTICNMYVKRINLILQKKPTSWPGYTLIR